MGIVDNSIPKITYKAGALDVERPTPYIDDVFDPLFNTEVRNYLYNKYDNNRLLATLGGYAELTDNALFGHKDWGILGPGMGIWSAFGRSMDKADDFILGGITEGVKGITGQGFENPMTNIFEKDQDYSGARLLSAMTNSFNSMSGGKIGGVTTEDDFRGWWTLPSLGIDLATDPGILGGATARATQLKLAQNIGNQTANKSLHEIGSILNQYDDIMAKVAGNVVVPGMHGTISKLMHQILDIVKHRTALNYKNVTIGDDITAATGGTDVSMPPAGAVTEAGTEPVTAPINVSPITSFRGDYDFLSNFYNSPISYNGIAFTNAESAFQAMKDPTRMAEFANLTPSAARRLGRSVNLRPDWDSVKEQIMREIVQAKFAQNPELMERLLRTGNAQLIEGNTWGDTFWGQVNGTGENRLGNILMDVRNSNTPKINPVSRPVADETTLSLLDMYADLDAVRKQYVGEHHLKTVTPDFLKKRPHLRAMRALASDEDIDDAAYKTYRRVFSAPDLAEAQAIRAKKAKVQARTDRLVQLATTVQADTAKRYEDLAKANREVADWLQQAIEETYGKGTRISVDPNQFSTELDLQTLLDDLQLPKKSQTHSYARKDLYRRLHDIATSDVQSRYNPSYIDDLFSVGTGTRRKYLWDYDPDTNASVYNRYLRKLASTDFENVAGYNTLMRELGFDPGSHKFAFINDPTVPYLQTTRYSYSPKIQREAAQLSSEYLWDLNKVFGPFKNEDPTTYAMRLLGEGSMQGSPISKRLRMLIPNDRTRERFIGLMTELNLMSSKSKTQALRYVTATEELAELLQKHTIPIPKFEDALTELVSQNDLSSEQVQDLIVRLTSPTSVIANSGNPLIAKYRPYLKQYFDNGTVLDEFGNRVIVSPEDQVKFLEAIQAVNSESEKMADHYVARANRVLLGKGSEFASDSDTIDRFVDNVNRDIYQTLHGTQDSLSELWGRYDRMLSNEEGARGLKNAIDTTKRNSMLGYDTVAFWNNVFRTYPEITKREDFPEIIRKLTPYYQFHLGLDQTVPRITPMNTLIQEFNDTVYPVAERVVKNGYSPFTTKTVPKGTDSELLQKILGYKGAVPERSPHWAEMRLMLSEQVEGQFKNRRFEGLVLPIRDMNPITNKWDDPIHILQFQRKAYENSVNMKFDTVFAEDAGLHLARLTHSVDADPVVKTFLATDAGRKAYPGYVSRLERVAAAPASTKVTTEAAVLEDMHEAAAQTMSSKDFLEYVARPTDDVTPEQFADAVEQATGPQRSGPKSLKVWELFKHISEVNKTTTEVSGGAAKSMETEGAKRLMQQVGHLYTRAKALGVNTDEFVHKFMREVQGNTGSVVHGKDFLIELLASNGRRIAAFAPGDSTYKAYQTYLQNAIDTVNRQVGDAPFLKLHTSILPNGNRVVGVVLNTELKSDPKTLTRIYKNLKKVDTSSLEDFVLVKPGTSYFPELHKNELYDEMYRFFSDLHELNSSEARKLGLPYSETLHVKDVYLSDLDTAQRFKNVIWGGLNLDEVSDFANQVSNQDRFFEAMHGAFYTQRFDNSLMGNVLNFETGYNPIFTTQLDEILQGTLAGGAYQSKNYQGFVSLFGKQFNIHDYMSGPEDILEVVMPGGSKEFANTHNLVFAAPKYDDTGRIVGFKRFNVLTDAGRKAAWENPNTVLLTESVFGPLDTVLKRQKRLSNKAYRWITRHITVPYKFGVLTNPGFLLGNLSDAYLKQATTMAQKYGTSVSEELANVAFSIGDVVRISNEFDTAYGKFVKACDAVGISLAPTERIPSLALGNKHAKQLLKDLIDNKVDDNLITAAGLTDKERSAVRAWIFLHETQGAVTFARNLRDAGDVAAEINKSPFSAPTNIFDRIFRGQGEYDPRDINTWGLFLNNPIAAKMMDSSEDIEHIFRLSSILNDLKHNGTSVEGILEDINKFGGDVDNDTVRKAYVGMQEAVDATANANFDYESSSDFMEAMAHIMPFPTFFLKNLGYWLQMFVENPQYIDNAIDIQNSLWSGKDTDKDEFQAEAKGRGAIPIEASGFLKDSKLAQHFKGIYKPTPLNSMFGALSAINNPLGDMMFRIHPIAATAAVTAGQLPGIDKLTTPYMTENSVQYRPYSTNPYEKNVKFSDPNFNPLQYAVHRFNPMERALNTALRTPAKMKAGTEQLSDFLPSIFQPDFSKKKKK